MLPKNSINVSIMNILRTIQNIITQQPTESKKRFIPRIDQNRNIHKSIPPAFSDKQVPAIMICIDVSPSMDYRDFYPSRLAAVQKAATLFAENIAKTAPNTQIGIIGFSRTAQLALPLSSVKQNWDQIKSSIWGLSLSPSTNLCEPLQLAQIELLAPYSIYATPRVILLTDGDHNCAGDPNSHANFLKAQGIQLDIIGIGSGDSFDEKTLKQMASVKNGELRYWFINSTEGLMQRFETLALRNS
jgi:Mg-chelatase subunit ChlD